MPDTAAAPYREDIFQPIVVLATDGHVEVHWDDSYTITQDDVGVIVDEEAATGTTLDEILALHDDTLLTSARLRRLADYCEARGD